MSTKSFYYLIMDYFKDNRIIVEIVSVEEGR